MSLIYDMHTHTNRSYDGEATLESQCGRAAELGLSGLAITDHCDVNLQSLADIRAVFEAGGADIRRMQEKTLPFQLFQGIELGEPLEDPAYAEEMLQLLPYDYVIGSIHNIPGEEDFYFLDYTVKNPHQLLKTYFEELIRLAEWGKTDSIAHITYPLRYIEGKYNIKVDLSAYSDQIDVLFQTIIRKNLALEINASGLRQELGRSMPDEPLVRRYYELGGRKIIFGSDAHRSCDLASGISECMKMCREIGFTVGYYFKNRQAIEYKL